MKTKMMLKEQASWAKMDMQGVVNSIGMPPNQKSKQSGVTNLFLYEHCEIQLEYLCYYQWQQHSLKKLGLTKDGHSK